VVAQKRRISGPHVLEFTERKAGEPNCACEGTERNPDFLCEQTLNDSPGGRAGTYRKSGRLASTGGHLGSQPPSLRPQASNPTQQLEGGSRHRQMITIETAIVRTKANRIAYKSHAWILLFATSQTHSAVRPIQTAASNATDFMALTRTNGEQEAFCKCW
jgi:hypothetical protein